MFLVFDVCIVFTTCVMCVLCAMCVMCFVCAMRVCHVCYLCGVWCVMYMLCHVCVSCVMCDVWCVMCMLCHVCVSCVMRVWVCLCVCVFVCCDWWITPISLTLMTQRAGRPLSESAPSLQASRKEMWCIMEGASICTKCITRGNVSPGEMNKLTRKLKKH